MGDTRLFSFSGRIDRNTYWMQVVGVVATISIFGIAGVLFPLFFAVRGSASAMIISLGMQLLVSVSGAWVMFATTAKRWHDLDKSGWMSLLSLIPVAGFLILIYLGVQEGQAGQNRWSGAAGIVVAPNWLTSSPTVPAVRKP